MLQKFKENIFLFETVEITDTNSQICWSKFLLIILHGIVLAMSLRKHTEYISHLQRNLHGFKQRTTEW
jgi:hypothetical protein